MKKEKVQGQEQFTCKFPHYPTSAQGDAFKLLRTFDQYSEKVGQTIRHAGQLPFSWVSMSLNAFFQKAHSSPFS